MKSKDIEDRHHLITSLQKNHIKIHDIRVHVHVQNHTHPSVDRTKNPNITGEVDREVGQEVEQEVEIEKANQIITKVQTLIKANIEVEAEVEADNVLSHYELILNLYR
jgi:hypothetical protein